jgi:hypothetical protein
MSHNALLIPLSLLLALAVGQVPARVVAPAAGDDAEFGQQISGSPWAGGQLLQNYGGNEGKCQPSFAQLPGGGCGRRHAISSSYSKIFAQSARAVSFAKHPFLFRRNELLAECAGPVPEPTGADASSAHGPVWRGHRSGGRRNAGDEL